jgi:hypothetical protein
MLIALESSSRYTAARAARAEFFRVSEWAPEGRDGSQLNARSPIGRKTKKFHLVEHCTHGLVRPESICNLDDGEKNVAGGHSRGGRGAAAFAAKKQRVDQHGGGMEHALRTLVPDDSK